MTLVAQKAPYDSANQFKLEKTVTHGRHGPSPTSPRRVTGPTKATGYTPWNQHGYVEGTPPVGYSDFVSHPKVSQVSPVPSM